MPNRNTEYVYTRRRRGWILAVLAAGAFWISGLLPPVFAQTASDGFNPTTDWQVSAFALQPDGKIIVGGGFREIAGHSRNSIARLHPDGTLDTGFNPPGGADDGMVLAIALQPDGKIVIAGNFQHVNGQSRRGIARLHSDGALDGWPIAV